MGKINRYTGILKHVLIWVGVILLLWSCSVRRSASLRGPLPVDDPQVRNGQIRYMAECQKCHPMGESGLGLAINGRWLPRFMKRYQVRHGLGVMPGFNKKEISDEDLSDILAYLKALNNNE